MDDSIGGSYTKLTAHGYVRAHTSIYLYIKKLHEGSYGQDRLLGVQGGPGRPRASDLAAPVRPRRPLSAPRNAQEVSAVVQGVSKAPPGALRDAPRPPKMAQDAPKTPPRRDFGAFWEAKCGEIGTEIAR